jgi:adenine-specific DNA-methyltransferase
MSKIDEATAILKELGLPKEQQNERSALTLLAIIDLKKTSTWKKAGQRNIRIHDIMEFIETAYGKRYAENTRETIRRQTLHQFEQAGIVIRNSDDSERPTNSPNTVYAIADEALEALRAYGSKGWKAKANVFLKSKGSLRERYEKRKRSQLTAVDIGREKPVYLSPGIHNKLQGKIVTQFRDIFCPHADVIYLGDTAKKLLHIDKIVLKQLSVPITDHDKLPDVVLYDAEKNHLFLVEAVTAHGPISPKRQIELEKVLAQTSARRIYVSAFPNFREFKKHLGNIAWDTEVWIEDNPSHMIHFNGPKFFSVYGG